jgi:hypothetical protein
MQDNALRGEILAAIAWKRLKPPFLRGNNLLKF